MTYELKLNTEKESEKTSLQEVKLVGQPPIRHIQAPVGNHLPASNIATESVGNSCGLWVGLSTFITARMGSGHRPPSHPQSTHGGHML